MGLDFSLLPAILAIEVLMSTLQPNEQRAVTQFLELLRCHHAERVQHVILYGSKVRGDSRAWSDIDILIVVDRDDWRLSHAISDLAADVSLEYDVLIGPRVIGQERWERMKQRRFGLYQNVAAEGSPLT
jgi:predicted nucleotidyltransferase